jgi:hypothetical protein
MKELGGRLREQLWREYVRPSAAVWVVPDTLASNQLEV